MITIFFCSENGTIPNATRENIFHFVEVTETFFWDSVFTKTDTKWGKMGSIKSFNEVF